MFKNIGKKIKTLAVVLFILDLVGFFLLGLIVMIGGAASLASMGIRNSAVAAVGGASVISGLVIWIVGFLASWIGSFFMYGLGELIDKTAENAANTKRIADMMSLGANPVPPVMPVQQPVQTVAPVPAPAVPEPAVPVGSVICPACGKPNDSGAGFCLNCGNKLK